MDPLNIIARSHDLALWARVVDYQSDDLDALLYRDRAFFDYGGNLRIYPMSELPYWRAAMRRKGKEARWASFASQNRALLKEVKAELRARGPLGNRDLVGRSRVHSYRGRKDTTLALYYLWLTGEVMVHHRVGFERVYDAASLFIVTEGHVPDGWRPLDTTTQEEVVFLAPLDAVSAGGRARKLFDFDYIWEVYKPAAKRRWGY